jgi:WD40 repeat protein
VRQTPCAHSLSVMYSHSLLTSCSLFLTLTPDSYSQLRILTLSLDCALSLFASLSHVLLLTLSHSPSGHQADVDLVQWHPNCHYVATASSDYTVRLWDVATGACVRLLTGLQAPPTSLAVCPDGKQVGRQGCCGV